MLLQPPAVVSDAWLAPFKQNLCKTGGQGHMNDTALGSRAAVPQPSNDAQQQSVKSEQDGPSSSNPPPVTPEVPAAPCPASPPAAATKPKGKGWAVEAKARKPTRWRRDKARLEGLEQNVAEQLQRARELEQEQQQLKMRNIALEHCIASRDWQLDILTKYQGMKMDPAMHSAAALAALSRDFVSRASLLMLRLSESCNTQADQAVLARISEAVADYFRQMGAAYVLNPGIQFNIIACHLDTSDVGSAPRPSSQHWEQVAKKVSITPQQIEEVAACWKQTCEAMAELNLESIAACRDLAVAMENNSPLALMLVVKRLQSVLHKHAIVYRGFSMVFFGRILAPFHLARVMVHAFPYFLDTKELVVQLLRLHDMAPTP